jgi:hypothetical protein
MQRQGTANLEFSSNGGGSAEEWRFISAGRGKMLTLGNFNHSHRSTIFDYDVQVKGNLSKAGGSFKIDHPMEPTKKFLYHSFVESPDMKNIYDGVVELDQYGEATVELPRYFEALNRDFRYQLSCVGGYAPVFVKQEVEKNRFVIAGGNAGLRISWQVTGIRKDAWANKHRIPTEVEKPTSARGKYLHPELYQKVLVRQSNHP